jgi:hypothetical protein
MSTARLLLMGPIGAGDDLTFAIAARRSYLEAYFEVMQAANLLDTAIAAPEYDELSARVGGRLGSHRLLLTLMRASDHLALVDSEDESAITIDGTFRLDDVVYFTSLDHLAELGPDVALQSTVGFSLQKSELERDFGGSVTRDVDRYQVYGRTDLDWAIGEHHALQVGASAAQRRYAFAGPVEDTRAVPTWAALPMSDQGLAFVTLSPDAFAPIVAGYAEHDTVSDHVQTRIGLRTTWVDRTDEVLPSPSGGVSVPLATGTVPKIAGGLYHHVVESPLAVDPTYGNPDLEAERAIHLVAGIDQALPLWDGGLLRVEGYRMQLDHLVVNPDNAQAVAEGVTFTNDGTGSNTGVDVLIAARGQRFDVATTFSWLHAVRTNPLNEVFVQTFAPATAQAVTAGASLEWQATAHWRFTGRYDFHTGRPTSSVEPDGPDTVQIVGLNDQRLGPFHQVDLRVEWRKATPRLRWTIYLDMLNTFGMKNDFIPTVSVTDGLAEYGMLRHLPPRPFLGLRADF